MKHLVIIIAAILIGGCEAANVEAKKVSDKKEPKCASSDPASNIDAYVKDTYARNKGLSIRHVDLLDEHLDTFLAALNRHPPKSDYSADRVVIFVSPTDPRAMVILSKEDCIENMGTYPRQAVFQWMNGKFMDSGT